MSSSRVFDKSTGLNLQPYQKNAASSAVRHEIISIPSDTAATFGGYFTFSLREINVLVHQLLLQFSANAITGMTTNPRYVPANFWIDHIDLVASGTIINTIYGGELHAVNNSFWDDSDRLSINKSAGHYANVAQRVALAATTSSYYVNLRSFIDQTHIPLLTANHNIQLRVYMNSLANCTVAASGTATNSGVTSCNLLARVTRMDSPVAQSMVQEMSSRPYNYFFHQMRLFSSTVTCSSTSASSRLILSPIVGSVPFMFFTVRSSAALAQDNYFTTTAVTSFAFLDGAGQNIVGGAHLPHRVVKDVLMREWTLGEFCAEDEATLTTSYVVPFSGSNTYMYSFSPDPINAYKTGSLLGARRFSGTEILELYFNATGSYTIDCYFYTEQVLTQAANGFNITAV